MKRLFIICVLLVVFLMGCGKEKKTELTTENIEFIANITYYNENYCASGSIDSEGRLTLEIKEPDEIEGMVYTVADDSVRVSYKGLTYSPNSNSLLPTAVEMLYEAFECLGKETAQVEYQENKNCSVNTKNEQGELCINFSPTGLPLDIKYLSGVFYAELSDLKILKNE